MALFDQSLSRHVGSLVMRHHTATAHMLGISTAAEDSEQVAPSAPLMQCLELLIGVANGERIRGESTRAEVNQVETALMQLQNALFGNAMQTPASIPEEFWPTDLGILCSRVRWWISADELITISNAAALAFGENTQANRMRISRAINNGILDWIPDPSVSNPQQNRRVLRSQVERLGEQRRRPE